jgi:hypothetical protein
MNPALRYYYYTGSPFIPDETYQAILDQASTDNASVPSVSPDQTAQNAFLLALKNADIWDVTDVLQVYHTNGSFNFAKYNWKNPATFKGSTVNGPQFSQRNGFKCSSGNYYNTGWAPNDGVNYTLNACEHIVYYKDITVSTGADGARNSDSTRQSLLNPQSAANTVNGRSNGNGVSTPTDAQFTTSDGLYFWGALNSTTEFVKKGNGSRVTFAGTRGPSRTTNQFTLGGLNQNTPVSLVIPNTRRQLLFWAGGLLTVEQEAAFKTAWDTYMAAIGDTPAQQTLGTLYDKSSWTDLTDFTNNGSTVSVVSNALSFSGGTGAFTQSLDVARFRSVEKWKISATVTVGAKSASSFGFGFGLRSTNTSADKYNLVGRFDMSTGANSGKTYINVGSANTQVVLGTTALTFDVSDQILFTVERNGNVVTTTAKNLTTNSATITETYTYTQGSPYMPNTGRLAIFSFGGAFTVNALTITSNEIKNAKLLIIGDSKTVGYTASNFQNRFARHLNENYNNVIVCAGGSDKTTEYLSRVQEIIDLDPDTVLIAGASNDPRFGVASATTIANYDSLVSQMEAANIRVIHSTGLYEAGGLDQTPLQTHIISTYDAADIWDSLNQVISLNADNVHPNDAGMASAAQNFINEDLL